MRRTSVSLPTKHIAYDPHEKPDRYESNRGPNMIAKMQSAWASQSQRARYLKAAAIIFVVFSLFYCFSPAGVDFYHRGPGAASQVQKPAQGQTPSDSSYGTNRCTRSHSKDKPIVQYVSMIDAGSTGSRIHVYKFNNCGAAPELEGEVLFKQTQKIEGRSSGLSAYKDDPEGAAKSLDPLLDEALKHIPDKLKACSPIAVKATAGLRLIGPERSGKILEAVRHRLEHNYPFPVVSQQEGGVSIMDGSDEGVYAWITTNYLLGKIGGPDRTETAAVFDLGGGSTQIVFQPGFEGLTSGGMPDRLADGDHKYELSFGGRKFTLYQHSHLGYGLMSARGAIHAMLVDDLHEANKGDSSWTKKPVINPCFSAGTSKKVKVELAKDHPLGLQELELNMTGPATAAPAQCRRLAEHILKKDAKCKLAPCSFNGVHQPSIAKTFSHEDVYFLSYFYDRTQPLGMPESFTLREMADLANRVCGGEQAWDVFGSVPGALDELRDRPEHCMDLNFMVALTHTGYEMPLDREVKIAKKIKDKELGWCLGASLPLLAKGSGWECKVTEVH